MKRNRIFLAITVGVLLLGFVPSVQAGKGSYNRPIEDWAVNNPYMGGWGQDMDNGVFREVYPDWWMYGYEEYEYSGHVIEKRLKDGSFLLTVNLNVKDIMVWIFDDGALVLVGRASFKYQFVCHLDAYIPGGLIFTQEGPMLIDPATRTDIDIIPWWATMYFTGDAFGAQVLSTHGVLAGEGECTGLGGYEAGPATFIVNQRAMGNKDFKLEHPKYYGIYGFWPAELMEIHQG
jgi:hypothetical protein